MMRLFEAGMVGLALVPLLVVLLVLDMENVFRVGPHGRSSVVGDVDPGTEEVPVVNTTSVPDDSLPSDDVMEPEPEKNSLSDRLDAALHVNGSVTFVNLCDSGMGHQFVHMVARRVLSPDETFIVDTRPHYMQFDNHTGLIGGWFKPNFALIQNREDYDRIPPERRPQQVYCTANQGFRNRYMKTFRGAMSTFHCAPEVDPNCKPNYGFFHRHARVACQDYQFNQYSLDRFQQIRARNEIPDFRDPQLTTVAIHVRRGDKIKEHESRLFTGDEYVQKMLQVVENPQTIRHVFVATDDYGAIHEVAEALKERNLDAKVHSMTRKDENGSSRKEYQHKGFTREEGDEFLAEVSMLVDATYFVGTMNSNVARFVALLRSCAHPNTTTNFYHSYDVENQGWYPL